MKRQWDDTCFVRMVPELWKVEGHDLKWSLEQALNSLSQLAKKEKAFLCGWSRRWGFLRRR